MNETRRYYRFKIEVAYVLEDPIHGIATRIKEMLIDHCVRNDTINPRFLENIGTKHCYIGRNWRTGQRYKDKMPGYHSSLFTALANLLGEDAHDGWVQVSHEDFERLIRFHRSRVPDHRPAQRVQSVEVPAVTIDGAHWVSCTIWKNQERKIDYQYAL